MPKCETCGKEVDLPFECKFCGGYFCLEHRLPENHNCPNLPPRTPLGGWQVKKEMKTHTSERVSGLASEGDFHFVRKEATVSPHDHKKKSSKSYLHFGTILKQKKFLTSFKFWFPMFWIH